MWTTGQEVYDLKLGWGKIIAITKKKLFKKQIMTVTFNDHNSFHYCIDYYTNGYNIIESELVRRTLYPNNSPTLNKYKNNCREIDITKGKKLYSLTYGEVTVKEGYNNFDTIPTFTIQRSKDCCFHGRAIVYSLDTLGEDDIRDLYPLDVKDHIIEDELLGRKVDHTKKEGIDELETAFSPVNTYNCFGLNLTTGEYNPEKDELSVGEFVSLNNHFIIQEGKVLIIYKGELYDLIVLIESIQVTKEKAIRERNEELYIIYKGRMIGEYKDFKDSFEDLDPIEYLRGAVGQCLQALKLGQKVRLFNEEFNEENKEFNEVNKEFNKVNEKFNTKLNEFNKKLNELNNKVNEFHTNSSIKVDNNLSSGLYYDCTSTSTDNRLFHGLNSLNKLDKLETLNLRRDCPSWEGLHSFDSLTDLENCCFGKFQTLQQTIDLTLPTPYVRRDAIKLLEFKTGISGLSFLTDYQLQNIETYQPKVVRSVYGTPLLEEHLSGIYSKERIEYTNGIKDLLYINIQIVTEIFLSHYIFTLLDLIKIIPHQARLEEICTSEKSLEQREKEFHNEIFNVILKGSKGAKISIHGRKEKGTFAKLSASIIVLDD